MSTSQVNAREKRQTTNKSFENEWALQGIAGPEFSYEDNFEADISLISNDSGYSSGDVLESSAEPNADNAADIEGSTIYTEAGRFSDIGYADTAASVKSNHGSIYNGILNESTQLIPSTVLYDSQPMAHPKSCPLSQRSEALPRSRKYTHFSDELPGPSPLEDWQQTYERHEHIAAKFQQPLKRRKTASGRQ